MINNNMMRTMKCLLVISKCNNSLNSVIKMSRVSLVAQWLRIRLPMQGTWVQALVREALTCLRVTKPVRHNY